MTRKEHREMRRLLRDTRRMTRMIQDIGLWAEREHARLRRREKLLRALDRIAKS